MVGLVGPTLAAEGEMKDQGSLELSQEGVFTLLFDHLFTVYSLRLPIKGARQAVSTLRKTRREPPSVPACADWI